MGAYHIHAAKWVGPLSNPEKHERHTDESDDKITVVERAQALAREGFTVWVYEHPHDKNGNGNPRDYKVVLELKPPPEK